MELKRVVVTGLGAITPLGKNVTETWENLKKGTSGANMITRFDAAEFKTKFACEVKDYNPLDYFDRKQLRKMDMFVQFAVIASDQAIEDADLKSEGIEKDEIGVIWGAGIGGIQTFQAEIENWARTKPTPRFNPFFIPKLISDIAPGEISMRHGFHGPNFGVVSACA
jgi:3-oxoacyl-[acyl-carrier-protein] synthase II